MTLSTLPQDIDSTRGSDLQWSKIDINSTEANRICGTDKPSFNARIYRQMLSLHINAAEHVANCYPDVCLMHPAGPEYFCGWSKIAPVRLFSTLDKSERYVSVNKFSYVREVNAC